MNWLVSNNLQTPCLLSPSDSAVVCTISVEFYVSRWDSLESSILCGDRAVTWAQCTKNRKIQHKCSSKIDHFESCIQRISAYSQESRISRTMPLFSICIDRFMSSFSRIQSE